MAVNCDPSSLANAARCFASCSRGPVGQSIKSYLLCGLAQTGLGPGAPTNIDIDANNSTTANVIVTWTNSTTPAATNEIWRSVNQGAYALFGTVGGAVSTFSDVTGGWGVGELRQYKVRACNGATCSSFTSDVMASNDIGQLGLVNYNFPTLIVELFTFSTGGGGVVAAINCPKLRVIKGDLAIDNEPNFTTLNCPALVKVGLNLLFDNDNSLVTFSLPSLTTCPGDINFNNDAALTSISIPSLVGSINDLNLSGVGNIGNFSLNGVTSANTITVAGFGGTGFSMTNLATVATDVTVSSGGFVTQINFPALTTIGGGADFSNNLAFLAINLNSLVSVANQIDFSGSQVTGMSFPALTTVGAFVGGSNCTAMTDLSFGAAAVLNDLTMDGCSSLANVTLTNVTFNDGFTINFFGGAVVVGNSAAGTGIDGILRRCVNSGLAAETITLDGFANATPSASGQVDKATLIGNGCAVTTN